MITENFVHSCLVKKLLAIGIQVTSYVTMQAPMANFVAGI